MSQFQLSDIKALILDMDGVLWKDQTPIGDLPWIFSQLEEKGIQTVFATNNAIRSARVYVEKLAKFGVMVDISQIFNSAMAVGALLKQKFPKGAPVYIVGESGLREHMSEAGFWHEENQPEAVVVGLDREITYQKITKAELLVRSGLPYFATNPDTTYPTPAGLEPGAGTIIAAVSAAAGQQPIFAGKPMPAMFNMALQKLGTEKAQTLAVGDRLDTDLDGGINAGVRAALVLTGVSTPADIEKHPRKADIIFPDLTTLTAALG